MTTIIAFVSQKGGVGKSTLSRALAREAAHSGLKTKIADLDTQQGTSIDWNRTRLNAGIQACAIPIDGSALLRIEIGDFGFKAAVRGLARKRPRECGLSDAALLRDKC